MMAVDWIVPALQTLVTLALNTLVPGILATLFVWLGLRLLRPNATTRYAVWFTTLLLLAALPLLASLELPSFVVGAPGDGVVAPLEGTTAPETPPAAAAETAAPPAPASSAPRTVAPEAGAGVTLAPAELSQVLVWLLLGAYLAGAGLLLFQLLRGVVGLMQLKRHSRPFDLPAGVELPLRGGSRTVELRRSDRITVPLAAGLFRPQILLPDDLADRLDPTELEHVILHELAHLARGDDWTKLAQQLLQALLFFHPAVHAISWQLDLTREIASDDWVIARRGRGRHDYAATLVRLVELALHRKRMRQPRIEGRAVMMRTQIERRIRLLLDRSRDVSERFAAGRFLAAVGGVLVAAVLLAQVSLFAIAQLTGRPVIGVDNAAEIEHLAEVEVFDWVGSVAFLPDGSAILSDLGDDTFRYWSPDGLEPLSGPISSGVGWPGRIVVSTDGKLIATAGDAGSVRLWDAATRTPLGDPLEHGSSIFGAAFSPDGARLSGLGFDQVLKVWEVASGDLVAEARLEGHGEGACGLALSPDGSVLATSGQSGVVHIWDAENFDPVATLEREGFGWSCVLAFSPDGSILAGGQSSSGDLTLWNTASWEQIGETLNAHRGNNFFALAFSPDGRLLASGGSNGMRLWDVATGEALGPLQGRFAFQAPRGGERWLTSTSALAFSPDGTLLAVGMGDANPAGEIHLWAVPTGE